MFGIGAQEIAIIGLLALMVFGPAKLPRMARELGSLVSKAHASMEEFKSELALEEARENLHRQREKDREPERRGLKADRRRLGNHQETGEGRRPEKPGEARDGDQEAVEDERPEEDRPRELNTPKPSKNKPPRQ